MKLDRVMIAAPKSGSGKTTITCAILQTLKDMGKQVVSYKCGPDYIDPMFHQRVIGIPSKNLDTFFTGENDTRKLLLKNRTGEEIAVIEGVMGLYDGLGGVREEGSSYHLAKVTKTPIILVINKIDTVEEKDILEAIDTYKDVCEFAEIIPVSALKGKNTDDVIDSIYKYLDEGPMYFDEDTITDQPERQICAELIREKALRLLSQEIPHGIAVVIDAMKVRRHGHIVDIDATIVCERDSHKGIIIGKQGSMLKKIGTQARIEMENLLDMKVNLQLWVKVKKDWRDSDMLLKNYGYDKKEV